MYSEKKCYEYFEAMKDRFEILGLKGSVMVMLGFLIYGILLDKLFHIEIWLEHVWQIIVPMIIPFILVSIGTFVIPVLEAICLWWIAEANKKEARKRS